MTTTATISSMTGFGRGRFELQGGIAVVAEAKTVNHKGLEVKLRLPRSLAADEVALTKQVRTRLERGRVDVNIDVVSLTPAAAFAFDHARVAAIVDAVQQLAHTHPQLVPTLTAGELLRLPGVVVEGASSDHVVDDAALSAAAAAALDEAIAALLASRAAEGAGLLEVVRGHRDSIARLTEEIAQRMEGAVADKRQKLQERLQAVLQEHLEPARLVAEVSLLAERLDVGEELARLRLHLLQLDALLTTGSQGCGRRLDFLCQELLREANTTASKCQDAAVAHLVVELKAEIERLREQAQNVE
jgi:uncharacterized protein (TIGR00255 family)